MTVTASVNLSDEIGAKLERLAARTGRSKSYYLREAV
ncbi:putative DNA-binding protein [Kocuria rhizophila]|nr:ribbon-helix-helix protein, CopG family [Kocuria rhizophila]